MKALAVYDTIGLPKRGLSDQLLFEEEEPSLFHARVEKLKAYILTNYPTARLNIVGPRLIWYTPNPSKYRKDRAHTLLIILLEGTQPQIPKSPVATVQEQTIADLIIDHVEHAVRAGIDPAYIPSLFANAAYLVLHLQEEENGTD